MRTLKFRFYDKTEKKMRYFDGIWNMPQPDYDFDEIHQFTGLLDRHGKEIYEGDIVENIIREVEEVKWNSWCFYPFYHCACGCTDLEEKMEASDYIIIGNVIDNPKFMKHPSLWRKHYD